MWCAARHCAFESHPLRQETPMQIASGFLHMAKPLTGRMVQKKAYADVAAKRIP